jgi:hypothetical protein
MTLEVIWTRGAESDLLDVFRDEEDFSAGRGGARRLVVIAVLNLRRSPAALRAEIQRRLPD